MNTSSVFIKLLPFNEHNFYVDLYSEYPLEATNGLKLLEEELSSELAFYIPETYHKKVIGAGGSTIQSIMRKYNVFIKFSSGFDCNPNGFTHTRSDNVLIRCPAKNAKEILPAKKELQEIVFSRSQEHGNTFVRLLRSHLRILLTQQNDFVLDIENKTNTIIIMPNSESFEDQETSLEIKGVMGSSEVAARMIKSILPEDYEFKVAASSKFDTFVSEDNLEFFEKVIVPFKVALKIEVQVFSKPPHSAEEAPYHQIVLSFSQQHSVGLEDAIQILTAYLRDKDLDIIDRGEFHVDPIVQGTSGNSMHGSKRRVKNDRHEFRSRDFDAGFNPPTRPRNHEPPRQHRNTSLHPPTEPLRMSVNQYERNTTPHTPSRTFQPEVRQSVHPYRKQQPGQPKRTFRQSPQSSNRYKYQPENDFDYHQQHQQQQPHQQPYYPPPSQHYSAPPPPRYPQSQPPQYPAHHQAPPPTQPHYHHQPAYDYPPRSPPPPQSSPSRPQYPGYQGQSQGSYARQHAQAPIQHDRHGYHRSNSSSSAAAEDYRQHQNPQEVGAYYRNPSRYPDDGGPQVIPTEPAGRESGGGMGRYREEWNSTGGGRNYRQAPGFAGPGPVGPPQGLPRGPPTGPYSEGYDRNYY